MQMNQESVEEVVIVLNILLLSISFGKGHRGLKT